MRRARIDDIWKAFQEGSPLTNQLGERIYIRAIDDQDGVQYSVEGFVLDSDGFMEEADWTLKGRYFVSNDPSDRDLRMPNTKAKTRPQHYRYFTVVQNQISLSYTVHTDDTKEGHQDLCDSLRKDHFQTIVKKFKKSRPW